MAKPKKKYSDLEKWEINFIKKKLNITKIQDIDTSILKQLRENLKLLKDSRKHSLIVYKLWDVIMCVIIASFADNNTWEDIRNFVVDNYKWFRSFLQMTGGIPTEDSYERIIGLIDKDELNTILVDFFNSISFKQNDEINILSLDGRINNGSKRNATLTNDAKKPLNCLNAYSNKMGYCVETIQIDEKSNEIPAIETLIKGLNLENYIVAWDALNTQTQNVAAVIDANGDYIVPIKGNQKIFYEDLKLYFDNDTCDKIRAGNTRSQYKKVTEKSHGEYITYECYQTSDVNWYCNIDKWKNVNSFGLIKKTIRKKGLVENTRKNAKKKKIEKEIDVVEYRYYISSRNVNIEEFYEVTRKYWGVENKLHWHLDFTFCQDANSTTNKNSLLNLEIIHKFVLSILEKVKSRYNKSLRSIRKHISNNLEEFFPEFICYLVLG